MDKASNTTFDYLYDRVNMLERENHLLRELESCRQKIGDLKKDILVEKHHNVLQRIKLLELKTAYEELCVTKNKKARQFDRDLAEALSHSNDLKQHNES